MDAFAGATDSSFCVATSGAEALDVPFTSSIDAAASSATPGTVDAYADANASGCLRVSNVRPHDHAPCRV